MIGTFLKSNFISNKNEIDLSWKKFRQHFPGENGIATQMKTLYISNVYSIWLSDVVLGLFCYGDQAKHSGGVFNNINCTFVFSAIRQMDGLITGAKENYMHASR